MKMVVLKLSHEVLFCWNVKKHNKYENKKHIQQIEKYKQISDQVLFSRNNIHPSGDSLHRELAFGERHHQSLL